MFDDFKDEEKDFWSDLSSIKSEHGFNSHEEAAEFVLEWFEMYDQDFVRYCESYLARY